MKPKITLYQAIKNIINDYFLNSKTDNIISRQEIIEQLRIKYNYFERQPIYSAYYFKIVYSNLYSLATLDNIRNMLEKVGFISKCYIPNTNQKKIKQGYYSINKQIPEKLTYNLLRKIYNDLQENLKLYFKETGKQLEPISSDYHYLQLKTYAKFI